MLKPYGSLSQELGNQHGVRGFPYGESATVMFIINAFVGEYLFNL